MGNNYNFRTEQDIESALQKERVKWQQKLEVEVQTSLEKEKKEWDEEKEIEILQKIQDQKVMLQKVLQKIQD